MDLVLEVDGALADVEEPVDRVDKVLVVGVAHFFNLELFTTDESTQLVQEWLHLVVAVDVLHCGAKMLQILGVVGGIRHEHQLLDVEFGHDGERCVCVAASPGVSVGDVSTVLLVMVVCDARLCKSE